MIKNVIGRTLKFSQAQPAQVKIVELNIKKDYISDFISATQTKHLHSVQEEGNLRFDVLQSESDPSKFLLYTSYLTTQQQQDHKTTYHYNKWMKEIESYLEKPRTREFYHGLYPRQ